MKQIVWGIAVLAAGLMAIQAHYGVPSGYWACLYPILWALAWQKPMEDEV
jgi:hypothetical protein